MGSYGQTNYKNRKVWRYRIPGSGFLFVFNSNYANDTPSATTHERDEPMTNLPTSQRRNDTLYHNMLLSQ